MSLSKIDIIEVLEAIASKRYLGPSTANILESKILEVFPNADDDCRFEELLHMLASYEPGGGKYLYDEKQLLRECERVLMLLKNETTG